MSTQTKILKWSPKSNKWATNIKIKILNLNKMNIENMTNSQRV